MRDVVYVTPNVVSRPSVTAIGILEMCNSFSKRGFNTTLCVPRLNMDKKELFSYYGIENQFEVMEVNTPQKFIGGQYLGRSTLFSIMAAIKIKKKTESVIYCRSPLILFIVCVLFRKTCFFEAHQIRFEKLFQDKIYQKLVKIAMASGNGRMVSISNSLKNQWINIGIEANKIEVLHDGVNLTKYNKLMSKSEARDELGFDKNIKIIVYTGSLLPGKGIDLLIECANKLKDINVVIVGGEEEQIEKYSKFVKNQNVSFLGYVVPVKVHLYQTAADILVLPNNKGSVIDDVTSPLKLFEYMASGRPIVATDMPSLVEVLINNHNALIGPADNSDKFSENISKLLDDPILSNTLAQNARKDVEKYTWDSRVNALTNLFCSSFSSCI